MRLFKAMQQPEVNNLYFTMIKVWCHTFYPKLSVFIEIWSCLVVSDEDAIFFDELIKAQTV